MVAEVGRSWARCYCCDCCFKIVDWTGLWPITSLYILYSDCVFNSFQYRNYAFISQTGNKDILWMFEYYCMLACSIQSVCLLIYATILVYL